MLRKAAMAKAQAYQATKTHMFVPVHRLIYGIPFCVMGCMPMFTLSKCAQANGPCLGLGLPSRKGLQLPFCSSQEV